MRTLLTLLACASVPSSAAASGRRAASASVTPEGGLLAEHAALPARDGEAGAPDGLCPPPKSCAGGRPEDGVYGFAAAPAVATSACSDVHLGGLAATRRKMEEALSALGDGDGGVGGDEDARFGRRMELAHVSIEESSVGCALLGRGGGGERVECPPPETCGSEDQGPCTAGHAARLLESERRLRDAVGRASRGEGGAAGGPGEGKRMVLELAEARAEMARVGCRILMDGTGARTVSGEGPAAGSGSGTTPDGAGPAPGPRRLPPELLEDDDLFDSFVRSNHHLFQTPRTVHLIDAYYDIRTQIDTQRLVLEVAGTGDVPELPPPERSSREETVGRLEAEEAGVRGMLVRLLQGRVDAGEVGPGDFYPNFRGERGPRGGLEGGGEEDDEGDDFWETFDRLLPVNEGRDYGEEDAAKEREAGAERAKVEKEANLIRQLKNLDDPVGRPEAGDAAGLAGAQQPPSPPSDEGSCPDIPPGTPCDRSSLLSGLMRDITAQRERASAASSEGERSGRARLVRDMEERLMALMHEQKCCDMATAAAASTVG